jgi:DNA-binding LytR/AlgR family response regulator
MYSVAVCDDEEVVARYISKCIAKRFREKQTAVMIDSYCEAGRLHKRIGSGTSYDILILDIDMPGLDGIEFCRKFRAAGGDSLVVFVSNKEDLVFQTFDVQPFRFVRKSCFQSEIDRLCKDLLEELDRRSDKWLRFTDDKDVVYSVNVRRVIYIEAFGKTCKLVSADGEREIRLGFKHLQDLLREHDFLQIHRSYLVNPYYIYRIDMEEVLLDDGSTLSISRRRREKIKEEFFEWSRKVHG